MNKNNNILTLFSFIAIVALTLLSGCSTEKDVPLNRGYHNMTARYNGYFNAGVIIDNSLQNYRNNFQDDYTKILPLKVYPGEEEAAALYAQMDDAIERCSKVIYRHSMPNPKNVKNKEEENCRWIDDNWLVIAKAHFVKREFLEAEEKLIFISTNPNYQSEESVFEAKIWLAKTYIALGNYPEATRVMKEVEAEKNDAEAMRNRSIKERIDDWKDDRKDAKKARRRGKKKEKTKDPASFPKNLTTDYEITMAELYIAQQEYKKAIPHLEAGIRACKKRKEKARYMFVLAQLYEEQGDMGQALYYYNKVAHSSAPYEMQFKAKIKKALVATGGGDEIRKELNKMLRDAKNAEYKDQIYFALAELEMKDGNKEEAIRNYTQSALWSVSNDRQKGISYLKLADIFYADKDYLKAQKYYDSSVTAFPDTYEDYEKIKNKAEGLSDLVLHYETYVFEDSVQQFVNMSDKDREKRLKEIIKEIEEREKQRKADEERRLQAMQKKAQNTNAGGGGSSSKWYFNNPKLVANGVNEFRTQWGQREDEDNWRRSNKSSISFETGDVDGADSTVVQADSLTVELLLKDIPLTPEALDSSNNRLINSLYMLGLIYKEQLKEYEEAIVYFKKVVDRGADHPKVLPSLYQLYLINKKQGNGQAENYKNQILTQYPDSEIAAILKDPDYLKKKEELDKRELNAYKETYDLYLYRYYNRTIAACNEVIVKEPENQFLTKYLLLKAFAISKLTPGAIEAISSPLETLVADYSDTEEGKQAKIYLGKIQRGENITTPDNDNPVGYTFDEKANHFWIVVYPNRFGPIEETKIKISNFNKELFRAKGYSISVSPINETDQLIIVKSFSGLDEGNKYREAYLSSSATGILGDVQSDFESYLISTSNFALLFRSKDIELYKSWYIKHY